MAASKKKSEVLLFVKIRRTKIEPLLGELALKISLCPAPSSS